MKTIQYWAVKILLSNSGFLIFLLWAYATDNVVVINDTADAACNNGKITVSKTMALRFFEKPKAGDSCLMRITDPTINQRNRKKEKLVEGE